MELLMGFAITLLLTLAFVQALILISKTRQAYKLKLPPGPKPFPILGNLFELGDNPHRSLAKLAKIHGPLMSLKVGRLTTVVISSPTMAKQVLQTFDLNFSKRIVGQSVQACGHHHVSISWLPVGAPWRNLRKICNSHIFTIQKLDANQNLRRKKVQQLLDDVQESCKLGTAVNIGQVAFKATLNLLSTNIFSLDLCDSSSDLLRNFKELVSCISDEAGKPNIADYFPFLSKIDPQGIKNRMTIIFGKLLDIFDHIIDERLLLRKGQGYIPTNDMLDTLLALNDEHNNEELDRNGIKHLFLDLFAAATDTTTNTLEWAMTELLRNPKTLSKAQEELEQTLGKGNFLQESDIAQLPFFQAIIKETFRLHPPVPFLIPRQSREDVEMCGFAIPKDAQVFVNVWAIGRDPSIWEHPDLFIPERFLNSNIDVRGQNFELLPFGAGRRICPGLSLGTRMLPLMLGSLIHSFDWKLEDGVTPENMNMEDKFGLTIQKAQPLRAIPIQLRH